MTIEKSAIAGTMESSDAQISVEPNENGIEIEIHSSVMNQYGRQIKKTVEDALETLGVESGKITVVDKGALDCTIKARVACAVYRAMGASDKDIPWGGVIR